MKKLISLIMLCFVSLSIYSEEKPTLKLCKKHISENNRTILAQSYEYILTSDRQGQFFLYYYNYVDIEIYAEVSQVTKDALAKVLQSYDAAKIEFTNNYVLYKIYYGLFDFYVVKTPKGNFFDISKKVERLSSLLDDL